MKNIFKVVSQSQPVGFTQKDGSMGTRCTIVLQEIGNQYEDSYACTMLGNLAQCRFYQIDIVFASLRFSHREYNQQLYQDVIAQDIVKLK